MRELTMIRHGPTEGNEKRWYYGATDLPLSEEGRARLIALREMGGYPDIVGKQLITTPYQRTRESAAILYPNAGVRLIPAFREVNFGDFECKSYEDLKDTPDYQAWLSGDWYHTAPPGGESFAEAETRIREALETLLAQPEDAVLVVHGGTIIVAMELLFPEEHKTQYQWQPAPGGGWIVDLQAHTYRPIPSRSGSVGHAGALCCPVK